MKKLTTSITMILFVLFLTACGNNEETKKFQLEQEGFVSTLVYTYEGDKVTKQSAENIVHYEQAGLSSKEQAQEMFEPLAEQFKGIDGITHEMEFEDSRLVEKLTIDFETVDFDEIKSLPGMNFTGDAEKGISMKESTELIESQGFEEVK